jgi:hypothetical protein
VFTGGWKKKLFYGRIERDWLLGAVDDGISGENLES